jgi:signal peptidase I
MHRGHSPRLTVTTKSMWPLLRPGDQIRLKPITIRQLQPGDIITFVAGDYLQTHRYWGTIATPEGEKLLTRGDRPLLFDAPTPIANLLGKVVARHRPTHALSLTTGWGGRLNQLLALVARIEYRWLQERQQQWGVRLVRRAILLWIWGITELFGFLGKTRLTDR